jgi:hypothetical protein
MSSIFLNSERFLWFFNDNPKSTAIRQGTHYRSSSLHVSISGNSLRRIGQHEFIKIEFTIP